MYGGGDYDAGASQFAGGGFMPSPAGAGGDGASTPAKGGRSEKKETLTPLTVCQLHEAMKANMDDNFAVDNYELHTLTLVGKVTDVQQSSTLQQYKVDDGTGIIEVRYWLDDDGDMGGESSNNHIEKGMYIRVFGNLRSFQGSKNIVAFTIRPITDFNEITYHLLETTFVHLHRTKGQQAGAGGQSSTPMNTNQGNQQSAYQTPQQGGGFGGDNGGGGGTAGMEPVQQQLIKLFESPMAMNNDAGLSIDQVNQQLNNMFNIQQIKTAIEVLVNEGHLYSTIDDNHYKSTAC